MADSIAALVGITSGPCGAALTPPAYALCFPLLRAVLSMEHHTALHEGAVQVLGAHVAPGMVLPRAQSLTLLYNVLTVVPGARGTPHPPQPNTPLSPLHCRLRVSRATAHWHTLSGWSPSAASDSPQTKAHNTRSCLVRVD